MGDSDYLDLGRAHFILRSIRGWRQEDVATAAGTTQGAISELERGESRRSLDDLERLATAMQFSPDAGRRTVAFLRSIRADDAAVRRSSTVARLLSTFASISVDSALELARAACAVLAAGMGAGEAEPGSTSEVLAEARVLAIVLWSRLLPYPPMVRVRLVVEGLEFHTFALCELVAAESERAAADSADEAAELARLALLVAGLVEGEPAWRARLEGYCYAHLANAFRVGGDLNLAKETFAHGLLLWEAGASSDPGILDPTRVLDLEASLLKDLRMLTEALSILDRALAVDLDPAIAGRLLIKKASTLEKLGRNEEALMILGEAAPLVDGEGNERLRFAIHFGVAVNLCELGRHAEAAPLLAEVRKMAERLGKKLDLLRMSWLEARVAGGLGRLDEAVEVLSEVQRELAGLGIAYDAALATLELAVLLLDQGRTAEVKRLAEQSKVIFDDQGVSREALATLEVFRRAAARQALTATLVRQLLAELQCRDRSD